MEEAAWELACVATEVACVTVCATVEGAGPLLACASEVAWETGLVAWLTGWVAWAAAWVTGAGACCTV
ncbi:MAG: hypothetical protein ACR2L9_05255 [Solirubrobacteraceae bacterium]